MLLYYTLEVNYDTCIYVSTYSFKCRCIHIHNDNTWKRTCKHSHTHMCIHDKLCTQTITYQNTCAGTNMYTKLQLNKSLHILPFEKSIPCITILANLQLYSKQDKANNLML